MKRKLIIAVLSVFFLTVVGYKFYMESDIRADALVTNMPMNETFDSTLNNKVVDTKDIESVKSDVNSVNDEDAIKGNNVLKVNEVSYDKPKVEYYRAPLIGLAKEGNYDAYLAVKGKIEGDSAALKIEWKNKIFYPRPINSTNSIQRLIKSDEIDEKNWTIIHYRFTLPDYVNRNEISIIFGGHNGNKFIGCVDSLSVVKTETAKADFGEYTDSLNWKKTTLPLNTLVNKPLAGLSIKGKGTIVTSESFIRISLSDKENKNYQVYENNSALSKIGDFNIASGAEETKALVGIIPEKVDILTDQSIIWQIDSIRLITKENNLDNNLKNSIVQAIADSGADKNKAKDEVIKEVKAEVDAEKLAELKDWAKDRNLNDLELGETDISKMTYEEKKAFFGGEVPNLRGFEYYQSGVFQIEGTDKDKQDANKSAEEKTKEDQDVLKKTIEDNKDEIEKNLNDLEAQAKDNPELQKNLDLLNQEIGNSADSGTENNTNTGDSSAPQSLLRINRAKAFNFSSNFWKLVQKLVKKQQKLGTIIPNTYDWRYAQGGKNYVTPVRTPGQGSCGSCWAWAATASIESKIKIKYDVPNQDFDLSEKMAMNPGGRNACSGGWPQWTMSYAKTNGLGYEKDVPYSPSAVALFGTANPARRWKISSFDALYNTWTYYGRNITPKDSEVKAMIYNNGPTAVCINDWNHCMLAVGYYWYNGRTAYIFKNSWGPWNYGGKIPTYAGYVYAIVPDSQKSQVISAKDPYPIDAADNMVVPGCRDNDKDGYVYCPAMSGSYPYKDCDDSNSNYPRNGCPGPYY